MAKIDLLRLHMFLSELLQPLIRLEASERQERRQTLSEPLEAMVAASLNAQGTATIELCSITVIQRFVACLQPDLIALSILRRRSFQFRQSGHMILGKIPDFPAIEVCLRPEVTVETAVRCHGRVDEQSLQAMALGEVGRIVAAKRAADQQRAPELGEAGFELDEGLAWMMMQCRNPQSISQA